MIENELPVKKKKHKAIAMIIVLIAIFTIFYFTVYPILLFAGFFDNPQSKNDIFKLVKNNINNFDEAIVYIKCLDENISTIKYEDETLYKCKFTNGKYTRTPFNNETLVKLFESGVQSITINEKSVEFFCDGAGREYYTGIVFSYDGNPIDHGRTSCNFIKEGGGWKWEEENGDNHYYCEKIEGNWYYYQMWY